MTTSRVALVTGASSGFGQATAALLSALGFQVFGTSRAPARNPAGTYDMLPLDVGSEISVQACIQTILERTGRIDLLVNNVALPMCQPAQYSRLSRSRSPRQSGRVALWDVRRRYAARLQKRGLPAPSQAECRCG